jgi:hypothetical protein
MCWRGSVVRIQKGTRIRFQIPASNDLWSHRLVVRTLASHAGNRGSSPRGTTNKENKGFGILASPLFYAKQIHFQPYFQPTDQKEPPVTEIASLDLYLNTIKPESYLNSTINSLRELKKKRETSASILEKSASCDPSQYIFVAAKLPKMSLPSFSE